MNPYKVLRVSQNASLKTIQKKFRKLVREAHPDMGGSREDFDILHRAYQILSDNDQRVRYDMTGDTSEKRPDNSERVLYEIITLALQAILRESMKNGVDPNTRDMVVNLRQIIQNTLKVHKVTSGRIKQAREILEASRSRFSEGFMREIVQGQINALAFQQVGADEQVRRHEAALKMMGGVKFTVDRAGVWRGQGAYKVEWMQIG